MARRRRIWGIVSGSVVLAALVAWPLCALGRSGGGQNYESSSSSSSSSSHDTGGAIWMVLQLLSLCFEHPYIGIPLVLGIGLYFLVSYLRSPDRTTRKALEAMAASDNVQRDLSGLPSLKARDAGFDLERFTAGVRTIVEKVNTAWCNTQMEPARRFVTDAVYLRFRTQIAMNARQGIRNAVADLLITSLVPVAVETDGEWDTIHVKLAAKARDVDLPIGLAPEEARKRLAGAPEVPFFEIWSMARRCGATTSAGGGVLSGKCANCGADLPSGEILRCEFCRTLVNGGTHDWVLAEITQVMEWQSSSVGSSSLPGYDALKQRDPGLNRQRVEDQASLLFWKWIEARVLGDAKRLARYAQVSPAELGVGAPESIDRAAVGAVDFAACDAVSDGQLEHVYVRVRWSAAADRKSEPVNTTNVLILARKVGVVTGPGRAALVCRECYGALDESDAIKCHFCGGKIGPGEQEWALEAVASAQAAERARQTRAAATGAATTWDEALDLPDLSDAREREVLITFMARVLMADGVIAPEEKKLLKRCASRWNVPKERLEQLLAAPPSATEQSQLDALAPEDRLSFLGGLVVAALVDGRIDAKERALLDSMCRALRLPPATVDEQIQVRSARRSASRAA